MTCCTKLKNKLLPRKNGREWKSEKTYFLEWEEKEKKRFLALISLVASFQLSFSDSM